MGRPTWTDRLGSARAAQMVGRDRELAQLSAFARSEKTRLLYVHGAGGSGKTFLLREWLRGQAAEGKRIALVDAQVDVSRPAVIEELTRGAHIVAVDDFHRLAPLEAWFYDVFLPSLDDETRVVVTSRRGPRRDELLDPAWRELMESIELGELEDTDARTYLHARGVSERHHERVVAFARGVPLWLCVAADLALAHPDRLFDAADTRETLRPVIEQLLDEAETTTKRRALQVASLLVVTTESLLARVLMEDAAHVAASFEWLRDRPYVQAAAEGIRLHDTLRHAVRADLLWRDPELARELLDRAYAAALDDVWNAAGAEQERKVLQLSSMLGREPGGMTLGGTADQEYYSDGLGDEEVATVISTIARYEGEEAAGIAALWLRHQREGLVGFRDARRTLVGFLLYVTIDESLPGELREGDPFARAALRYLEERAPLRPGEKATFARWWVSIDGYQRPDAMQMRLFSHMGWRLVFTGPAVVGAVHGNPEYWLGRPDRPHDLFGTFEIAGTPYGIFGSDWRRLSRKRWAERLVSVFRSLPAGPPGANPEFDVLGRDEFDQAVRAALRGYARKDRLAGSPLLSTHLVARRVPPGTPARARVDALVALLAERVAALASRPRTQRHALTLEHAFLRSEGKGLAIAGTLGLPYGSYRRILNEAVQLLVDELWNEDLGANPSSAKLE